MDTRQKLLLHSCCGPCSAGVLERIATVYDTTIFFYNPNVTDSKEYEKRRDAQIEFINYFNRDIAVKCGANHIKYIEGPYDNQIFYNAVSGLETEPEGGKRCEKCFLLRLSKTAMKADSKGFDCFSTTLSVSPHKNHKLLCRIGNEILTTGDIKSSLKFIEDDFKKKDGYKRSVQLVKEYGIYRQNYCGCDFPRNIMEKSK